MCPGLPALEAAASLHGLGFPILPRQLHTRRMLQVIEQNDNSKVDCKSRWKPNRTNKISAGRRCCSIDSWIVLFSFLFRSGPHMLISKTGYAKKLTPWVVGFVFILIYFIFSSSYCGPDAPKFDKSDFEKGKVRAIIKFNFFKNCLTKIGSLPGQLVL